MADLDRNTEATQNSTLTGGDELHKVDIILDTDGKNKMLVKSDTSISTELGILQEYDQNNSLTGTFEDIYTAVGSKTISGFALRFDDNDVNVRLEIDGNEIFDIYCKKLKDILDWNSASLPPMYVSWNDSLKTFYFTPNFPLKSGVSINIQAKGSGKKYESSIIQVSN